MTATKSSQTDAADEKLKEKEAADAGKQPGPDTDRDAKPAGNGAGDAKSGGGVPGPADKSPGSGAPAAAGAGDAPAAGGTTGNAGLPSASDDEAAEAQVPSGAGEAAEEAGEGEAPQPTALTPAELEEQITSAARATLEQRVNKDRMKIAHEIHIYVFEHPTNPGDVGPIECAVVGLEGLSGKRFRLATEQAFRHMRSAQRRVAQARDNSNAVG